MLLALAAILATSPADAAMSRWMQCLADQAQVFARSSEGAETAADAAMGACAAEEGALVAIERRRASGTALRGLQRAQSDGRAVVRQRVIARVVEIRTVR